MCSLKHCRKKKGNKSCLFPSRNPFLLSSFLFYGLSERYKHFESLQAYSAVSADVQAIAHAVWRSTDKWISADRQMDGGRQTIGQRPIGDVPNFPFTTGRRRSISAATCNRVAASFVVAPAASFCALVDD